jgi:hypothetical protein
MAILCDQLISSQDIPQNVRKMFYGGITLMPQVKYRLFKQHPTTNRNKKCRYLKRSKIM